MVIYIYQYQDSILDPCFGAIVQFNLLLAVCINHNECFLSTLAQGYQPFTLLLQRFFSQWIKIIRGEHGHQVFMCCTITYGVSNDGYDTASDLIQQVPKRGVDFGCASPTFQLRSGFQSEFISTVFNIWFLYILYERVIQKPKNKKSSLNGTVLRRSGLPREYTVNKAGPQNHDTVGSVERGVREVKEALAVLRLELAKAGLDLVDSLVAWEAASRYVTAMHNLHGKIQNTGKTGKELLRNTSEGTRISAMFCSRVLAETPESVDSIGRFVTAAYLYPVRNSFAHFVCAKIADELKFFQAKSLKLVFPIEYPQDLIERFVCHSGSGDHPSLVDQAPIEILPEDFARLPDQVQPPRHWVDAHGRTEGCSSCATRQGRHSKKCCERYWNWIRNQKKGEVPAFPTSLRSNYQ